MFFLYRFDQYILFDEICLQCNENRREENTIVKELLWWV